MNLFSVKKNLLCFFAVSSLLCCLLTPEWAAAKKSEKVDSEESAKVKTKKVAKKKVTKKKSVSKKSAKSKHKDKNQKRSEELKNKKNQSCKKLNQLCMDEMHHQGKIASNNSRLMSLKSSISEKRSSIESIKKKIEDSDKQIAAENKKSKEAVKNRTKAQKALKMANQKLNALCSKGESTESSMGQIIDLNKTIGSEIARRDCSVAMVKKLQSDKKSQNMLLGQEQSSLKSLENEEFRLKKENISHQNVLKKISSQKASCSNEARTADLELNQEPTLSM